VYFTGSAVAFHFVMDKGVVNAELFSPIRGIVVVTKQESLEAAGERAPLGSD